MRHGAIGRMGGAFVGCFALAACATAAPSSRGPVDYSRTENWAALPNVPNASMRVPAPALKNGQEHAVADVFYIYPTVFSSLLSANASIDDAGHRRKVAKLLLTSQASSLNNVARVYAPYYRQASLWVYLGGKEKRRRAFDLAYRDVEAAFRFYLARYNRGRPLFILAHSQGSQMAVRLLREHRTEFRLERILVAAYLIGERIGTRSLAGLPPCTTPTRTNCFVTWGTVLRGGRSKLMTGEPQGAPVCINPLSWRMDERPMPAERHLGGVPDGFDRILPHLVAAECDRGLLNISPAPAGFAHDGKDYHRSDVNLFYMDIRRNAQERLQSYLRRRAMPPGRERNGDAGR